MFENLNKKQKIIFIIILIFMVSFIVYYIYSTLTKYSFDDSNDSSEDEFLSDFQDDNTSSISETEISKEILVHVSGCVKNNKVVKLKPNSRVQDAIDAAGGLTNDADLTNINLAYILEDGEKIYIPKKGEPIADYDSEDISFSNSNSQSSSSSNKININKATQAELETIPGIGPSTASKIVEYRNENGKFSSIEDIKNVSGIGDAKFASMKDYITAK